MDIKRQTSNCELTLKAWPVIAAATIGLCYFTQLVAGWFGLNLPEQTNVEVVKNVLTHAFDDGMGFLGSKRFWGAAIIVAQVVFLLPALEECLFRLPTRWLRHIVWWAVFSAAFSAAHYITQPFPDNAFLALFFFGLAQCWLYRKTGRLWCAMVNHALFNLTNLILLFIIPETP